MEKIYISDLNANQEIVSIFLVSRKETRTKKNGNDYLLMSLSDKTGQISAFLWENVEEYAAAFDSGDYVKVKALVREYNSHLQLTVHKIRRVPDSEVEVSKFLPATKEDVESQFQQLLETIQGFKNDHLRQLLQDILGDPSIADKFRRAPAAKKIHHAYLGGLLDHTLSLVRLCHLVGQNYPTLNTDLLVAGAILHDLGKIEELSYDRSFDYSDEGRLLGHIVMEVIYVNQAMNQMPDFPQELRLQLLHLLVAHHGRYEFGSPKLPMTLEALVLHYLDDLDGKVQNMQGLIAKDRTGGKNWTGFDRSLERYVYRRKIE